MKRLAVLLALLILALLAGCVQQQAPTAYQESTATDPGTSETAEEDGEALPASDGGYADLNIYGDTDIVPPAAWGDDDAREFWQGHFGDDLAQVTFHEVRGYRGKENDGHIDLSNHALTPITSQLKQIESLKVLTTYGYEPGNTDYIFHLNLKKLWLADCELRELPPLIGDMTNLEYLDLSNNVFLTQLPDEMEKLTNLHTLIFWGGYTKHMQYEEEFPGVICELTSLRHLELTGHFYVPMPDEFGNLVNLEYLNIFGGSLTELPDTFQNLQQLKYLNITGHQFSGVPEIIGSLTDLEELGAEGITPNWIFNMPNLHTFNGLPIEEIEVGMTFYGV